MSLRKKGRKYLDSLVVKNGKKISLKKFDTGYSKDLIDKEEGEEILQEGIKQLAKIQDILYANDRYSILIVLQAMDAAGKDGAIKHVMSGLNPQGVKVSSFKSPSTGELDHDYFWRHAKELPARGEIGIFNRSHYENVLVTKVHPEYILKERIPGIYSVNDIDADFWEQRYKQINRFEKNLVENGTLILKFFLHVSKDEQKKRFLERIDNPEKNWKFSVADYEERKYWNAYQKAYEDMLVATSSEHAPWLIIPADDKWFTRVCLGAQILFQFENLKMKYPEVSKEQKKHLEDIKVALLGEK